MSPYLFWHQVASYTSFVCVFKIEVESPRSDLVVGNNFHTLALIKGESVTLEHSL